MRDKREKPSLDFEMLAVAVDGIREMTRAMVAGLVEDGFTDEQARAIVAGTLGGIAQ